MWRWLSAEPRDVVDLAGAGTIAGGADGPHLGEELRRWRGIVGRRRLIALLRRHAAVALVLAALLEILAQLGALPQWVVVAVPLALFVVSVTFFAFRGPSPFGLARLLDDKLGLNDRLATALEIEARGGAGSPLEARTVGDAAALLRAGREDWRRERHPRRPRLVGAGGPDRGDRRGGRGRLGRLLGQLLLGSGNGARPRRRGGQRQGRRQERRQGQGKEARKTPRPDRQTPQVQRHRQTARKRAPNRSPNRATSRSRRAKSAKRWKRGNRAKATAAKGGKAPTGKLHKAAGGKPGENEGSEQASEGTEKGKKEKEHPTVGFNVKGQNKGGHGRPGTSEVQGAGNKPSAPNGQQDEASSTATEGAKKGIPAGAGKAGGEQGNNSQGHATPIKGQASQAVKIQPGYAPSRSSKGGKEHKKPGTQEGGGGKARTAQVTGATQVGSEFSFVPAAGGATPGAAAGLQQNYTESLKWVERLPW